MAIYYHILVPGINSARYSMNPINHKNWEDNFSVPGDPTYSLNLEELTEHLILNIEKAILEPNSLETLM